jgi:hypothetical protein
MKKLRRAKSLKFELVRGRSLIVPPPSIDQIERCLEEELHGRNGEDEPREARTGCNVTLLAQLKILAPDAPIDELELTEIEARQITHAFFAYVRGIDPNNRTAIALMLNSAQQISDPARIIEELERIAFALSVHNHCTPAAAAEMPIVDALSQMHAIADDEKARAKFEAALHDKKLR